MDPNTYKKNLLIPFLKMVIDSLAIESAFLFSFYLRFHSLLTRLIPVTKGYPPFINYLSASVVLLLIYLVLFSIFHAYRSRYFSTFSQDIPVVLKTCFLGLLFAMSGAFLYRGFSYSRLTFFLMFVNSTLFVLIGRYLFHLLRRRFMRSGYGVNNLILAGSASVLPRFLNQMHRDTNIGLRLTGYCSDSEIREIPLPYYGNWQNLPHIIADQKADGVMLAFESDEHDRVLKIMRLTEGKNIELFYVPDFLDILTSPTRSIEIGGMPVLRLKSAPFSGWQGFLKRTFDISVSSVGLVVLSPFMAFIAGLIKLTSPGPVFFKQNRVGLDGKEFVMLKFRSMMTDAEQRTGPVWAKRDDPRTTLLGGFLRRTSLDELPQLINVFTGDMSLVGPRPERKVFVEKFQQHIPQYAERHRVRSGMTGWAQVNGLRGQSPIDQRTRFDVYYIENWTLWFDIKIILMTFMAIIKGENAY